MWRTTLTLLIAALLAETASLAQTTAPKPPATPGSADFRVVVWYRRDQPLETFKYQAYDERRGEYTPAVDDWITLLRTKYPAYQIRVRNVFLDREKGVTEALKEVTATYDFTVANGFEMKYEYRRDWSNVPIFLTGTQNVFSKDQNTATLGVIWWFGRKQGSW